jgi:hypothetical protein
MPCFHRLAGALLALAPLAPAHADLLAFDFRNDTSWGRILFNSGVADTDPDPRKGRYMNSVVGYSLHITGVRHGDAPAETFFEGTTGSLLLGFQADGVGACGYVVDCVGFNFDTPNFPPHGGDAYRSLSFDYAKGTLTSDAIPVGLSAAGLSIFLTPEWQSYLGRDVQTTIAAVPEPQTWVMLLLGAGLVVLSRQRTF